MSATRTAVTSRNVSRSSPCWAIISKKGFSHQAEGIGTSNASRDAVC
jgi:hypothetical protein